MIKNQANIKYIALREESTRCHLAKYSGHLLLFNIAFYCKDAFVITSKNVANVFESIYNDPLNPPCGQAYASCSRDTIESKYYFPSLRSCLLIDDILT
ncbi:unnamed protein product [Rhizophagus irregularis]|uniref:Uncharacterized protein n=1 Tax=Rhizophagus irregularis TaxID=588596 RepID=A0A916EC29_9GLOM|nr:unnamed protein product [Rhizophagus irregularis]CAB5379157.1 unnamed protein product [Rhizophagus irregularis]